MKPGCFVKSIITLTIIVAVIVWILQNKFDDFIVKPGRKALAHLILNGVDKKFDKLKETAEKDSLTNLFHDLMNNEIYSFNNFSDKMFNPLKDSLDVFGKDSIIDKKELGKLKEIFRDIKYEGSKKN